MVLALVALCVACTECRRREDKRERVSLPRVPFCLERLKIICLPVVLQNSARRSAIHNLIINVATDVPLEYGNHLPHPR
ncbi:hypothetical protein FB446DRAFT_505839 [Lentinula raphanica]|nr:hypothetical protein FB446DRAFT_505839 [Lentinula raphanica]